MHKFALLALATLAGAASAQQLVLPREFSGPGYGPVSYYGVHNGISAAATWGTTAFRSQMIYDTAVLTGVGVTGPITITRLRWRATDGVANPGGQVFNPVTIQMSSSPSSHSAPSTTFATNRGADLATVFTGSVTIQPAAGTAPNTYVADVTLTTPFVYDPTLGSDLLIETSCTASPVPSTGLVNMACSATTGYVDGGSRVRASSTTATTGTASAFSSVIAIDFTGPGGTNTVVPAENYTYGAGCSLHARTYYENWPAPGSSFDLRAVTPGTVNSILMTPSGADNYVVTAGSNNWYTPTGSRLLINSATPATVMGDDSLSVALNLPFTFTFPTGSTSVVHAASNGYVVLASQATTVTSSDLSPSPSDLVGATTGTHYNTPRLVPAWKDWHASTNTVGTGALLPGVYFDTDAPNGVAYVTWHEIGEFSVAANTSYNSFQVAIYANGNVEYRYGTMPILTTSTSANIMTGWSPGRVGTVVSADPGNRDISATLPFATDGPDVFPLGLNVQAGGFLNATRAVLGQTVIFTTTNIQPSALISAFVLSFGQIPSGIPIPGAPTCSQYIDLNGAATTILPAGPGTQTNSLVMPTDPSWLGANLFSQSASLNPAANAFGIDASNGLRIVIGNF